MHGLVTSSKLSLRVADEIATKAIEIAIANSFKPISVCVMDPSGHAIVTKRMDDCPPIAYPKISFAKANTCVSTKSSSRAYGMKYLSGKNCEPVAPDVFARVLNQISIMDGKMAAFQGGVLIRESGNGEVVGSIGVSGAAGDEDEYCALRAVKECSIGDSLITEPSDHSCNTVRSHL
mmetsp:Transcript_19144/g.26949  ORF Transcript_19144/g.26949 Transcript_19144/m.26949 type:complete len:177 (+) Transcript_19144:131-661(+)